LADQRALFATIRTTTLLRAPWVAGGVTHENL
jgi:hypothetical protein